ncbi:hypothetical protein [Nocardioides sp. 1609]|uniref:hypothetical protein n=1 Tax=Nocardioides sp. 1609 TaxID=2508327 RepID=UPI00106FF6E1|nr:hypothetical protein [Nocardioides sp. 1609]
MTEPRRHRRARLAALAATGLLIGPVLVGCSGDDEPGPATTSSSATPSGAAAPLTTKASLGTVTGRLPRAARDTLRTDVSAAVDAWIDGAYGGDYPRTDFDGAFASFTSGARERAAADRRLMTNAGLGESVDTVEMTARRVRVDALARSGRAAAATAHVHLGLQITGTDGDVRRDRVTGSLFLTLERGAWKVFGYDVARGRV